MPRVERCPTEVATDAALGARPWRGARVLWGDRDMGADTGRDRALPRCDPGEPMLDGVRPCDAHRLRGFAAPVGESTLMLSRSRPRALRLGDATEAVPAAECDRWCRPVPLATLEAGVIGRLGRVKVGGRAAAGLPVALAASWACSMAVSMACASGGVSGLFSMPK